MNRRDEEKTPKRRRQRGRRHRFVYSDPKLEQLSRANKLGGFFEFKMDEQSRAEVWDLECSLKQAKAQVATYRHMRAREIAQVAKARANGKSYAPALLDATIDMAQAQVDLLRSAIRNVLAREDDA